MSKIDLKPLTAAQRKFTEDNYHLVNDFFHKMKLNSEQFYNVVIFDFLLSVEIYLDNTELQNRYPFEAISFMYMKRAVYRYFRGQKAKKRSSESGADVSFDELESYAIGIENVMSDLEYTETVKEIENLLTEEQNKIFHEKLNGYSLKEIAEISGIDAKRVYRQFGKIKNVVENVMKNCNLM